VVLLNDRVHTIWRVDPERLRAAIAEATSATTGDAASARS
jgi:hypothetical protein